MKDRNWIKRIINEVGCFVACWILHNCEDGLIISRKNGASQIIKVFSEPAYRNMIKPMIHKATEIIKVGDVVTDDGYHGNIVITCIDGDTFRGYYLSDGLVVAGLPLKQFKKIIGHVDVKVEYTEDSCRRKAVKR